MSIAPPYRFVGQSVLRSEGREKVTGVSRYVDDNHIPDCLYGKTIRSTIPKGRIRSIYYGEGISWDEFTIVTAADIPHNMVALKG